MIFTLLTQQIQALPFYVTGIGIQAQQEAIVRPNGLEDHQWLLTTKGKGRIKVGEHIFILHSGVGLYLNAQIPHSYEAITDVWETYWVIFNGHYVPHLTHALPLEPVTLFCVEDQTLILNDFQRMYALLEGDAWDRHHRVSAMLYNWIMTMYTHKLPQDKSFQTYDPRCQEVVAYMEKESHLPITLENLADTIGVSSQHLCRLFKNTYSITPIHYLMKIRVQKAKQLLIANPSEKIMEISQQVGYQDVSYFCELFKKYEGVSPNQFRKLHGLGKIGFRA